MSPQTISRRASLVAYGQVVQIEVNRTTGARTAVFEPIEVAKGSEEWRRLRDFRVALLTRALPNSKLIEIVPGAPELRLGDELVLYLRPVAAGQEGDWSRTDGQTVFSLEGFHQGRLRVVQDDAGRRLVAGSDEWTERGVSASELRGLRASSARRTLDHSFSSRPLVDSKRASSLRPLSQVLDLARSSGSSEGGAR